MASGITVPTKTGNGVYHKPGTVGAGPDPATANAYLECRATNKKLPLWIYEFTSDFSATGVEAQSRNRKEFFARFFTQPRYAVKGQTANQHDHQELGEFVRHGMLLQVASAPLIGGNRYFEAFVLHIEGRSPTAVRNRNTKGGHMGWTAEGYIESMKAGGQRFVNSPEFEFVFVLANATEGPMKVLDSTYLPQKINSIRDSYLGSFNKPIDSKEFEKPSKSPKKDSDSGTGDAILNFYEGNR